MNTNTRHFAENCMLSFRSQLHQQGRLNTKVYLGAQQNNVFIWWWKSVQFQKIVVLKKFDDGHKKNLSEYSRYFAPVFNPV
jgi:hypothetical protein